MFAKKILRARVLKQIIDFELVLKALGADYKEHKNYFSFRSLLRENKKRSMSMLKSNGTVVDWGGSFKGSVYALVKAVTGKSLIEFMGLKAIHKHTPPPQKLKRGGREPFGIKGILRPISDNKEVLAYCKSRMTNLFMKDFDIKHYFRQVVINGTPYYDRLIIPIIRDRKIVSLELRDYTREQKKKTLYPEGSSVSCLFNTDRLLFDKPLVLVEGILDIPKIYTHCTHNVTTTFGINITSKQKSSLRGFKELVLFPDDDDGGKQFIENMREVLGYDFKIALVRGKDPGESSVSEIKEALLKAKCLSEYEIDYSGIFNEGVSLV